MLMERLVERSSGEKLAGDLLSGAIHLAFTTTGTERENLAEALVQRLDRPMEPELDPFAVLIADLRSAGLDPDAVRLADARWVAGNLGGSRGFAGVSTALSAGGRRQRWLSGQFPEAGFCPVRGKRYSPASASTRHSSFSDIVAAMRSATTAWGPASAAKARSTSRGPAVHQVTAERLPSPAL
ncbi:hypothetical protein ACFYWP_00265 [Actinacidiphila glaucinigra]|uniref:hypothetical protein n=1 Tax=Actinacidiphila glaucinigra TaxID=235986 RepID=UPI0036BFA2F1